MSDESTPTSDDALDADLDAGSEADADEPPEQDGDGDTEVGDDLGDGDALSDAHDAIADARRRLAEVPAEVVVTNHAMGLYELAAIHLSGAPPDLRSAALAIDAMSALVDGLGDRLGPDAATMRDALATIRMAFVQVKAAAGPATGEPDGSAAADAS